MNMTSHGIVDIKGCQYSNRYFKLSVFLNGLNDVFVRIVK